MKVVIPGGTGQVGVVLARSFQAAGHEVVILSRQPVSAPWRVIIWDGEKLGAWAKELDGADVVINLAGRSVNCRDHAENRRQIVDSRIKSTRAVAAGGLPVSLPDLGGSRAGSLSKMAANGGRFALRSSML